jgi:pilus assembly protein CpaF
VWIEDDELERLVRELRAETTRRLSKAFAGRDFLALSNVEASEAQRIVFAVCDEEDRARILRQQASLGTDGRKQLAGRMVDEIFGMGVLQRHLDDRDPTSEEYSVNRPDLAFVTRSGNQVERTNPRFASPEELRSFIQRQVSRAGGRIDEASPYASVRMANGCRLTAVLPPITACPRLTVRVPRKRVHSIEDLANLKLFSPPPERPAAHHPRQSPLGDAPELARFLQAAVAGRLNILVSGGTGTGKTTTLRGLCGADARGRCARQLRRAVEPAAQLRGGRRGVAQAAGEGCPPAPPQPGADRRGDGRRGRRHALSDELRSRRLDVHDSCR